MFSLEGWEGVRDIAHIHILYRQAEPLLVTLTQMMQCLASATWRWWSCSLLWWKRTSNMWRVCLKSSTRRLAPRLQKSSSPSGQSPPIDLSRCVENFICMALTLLGIICFSFQLDIQTIFFFIKVQVIKISLPNHLIQFGKNHNSKNKKHCWSTLYNKQT